MFSDIRNVRDMLKKKPLPELQAGYMQFIIPGTGSYDEELVWGWVSPENKEKMECTSYNGQIDAYLLSQPENNFSGRLNWGVCVSLQCHGGTIPVLSSVFIETHLL